jgi:hypothetical protein
MRKSLVCFAVSAAACVAAVPAAARDPVANVAVLSGDCSKLVFADTNYSAICDHFIANIAYQSGHSSFQFAGVHRLALGFYGTDHEARGDESYIMVEKVDFNDMKGGPSTMIDANGRCTYTNPYAGPSRVECSAVASGKTYAASFLSDGEPPAVRKP